MKNDTWLLPEGIEEVLPPRAAYVDTKCRTILDLYQSWGYELVMPPLIEYLESLLTGYGDDLELLTFKLTDQLNGRMMGVRADMTPQVARIDAHQLRRTTPTRLCYMGTVLHTRPQGFGASRAPMQVGLELYGHAGVESDVEVFQLMVLTLSECGLNNVYFDLGHVGIYRGLVQQAGLNADQEADLFDALLRKAIPELKSMLDGIDMNDDVRQMLLSLASLNGDDSVLAKLDQQLAKANDEVKLAIQELKTMAEAIKQRIPGISLHYDVAELRGYHYHTGVVFAAFTSGKGSAVAQGGRYDGIGSAYGISRPATGFSTDLKTLLAMNTEAVVQKQGIFAPADNDAELQKAINEARANGERVIVELPGQQGDAKSMDCDRQFIKQDNQWLIKPI